MYADDIAFEDEVRRIARLLWPAAQYGGAAMEDGRERDGLFETEDFVHIVECTTARTKKKAEEDLDKIQKLIRRLGVRAPQKFIKGWFVTLEEPTADQRTVFGRTQGRIVAVSFDQFRSRLVDARSYLSARKDYPFGSVRDPETGAARVDLDYVPLDILDETGGLHSVESISALLQTGGRFVVLGDYGAGKSATVREIHFDLASGFYKGRSRLFPITLNLRDHHGQTDPVEVLERHARNLGIQRPSDLVRGWRAGYGILLLDGFDEIATAGWAGKTKKLRDLRFRSMELIRAFCRDTPSHCGVLLAGRAHFFDNRTEMASSLALGRDTTILNVSEFNDDQVKVYLERAGWTTAIPAWIPSRPLLLGYLAARKLLQRTLEAEAGSGPAVGWSTLIDRICEREAEIEAGIDAGTVRHLLGHLASLARSSADGLGPLMPEQITDVFTSVCGYTPDDRALVLLQRMPGLGGHSTQDGSRVFIDQDFAEASRGCLIADYMDNPYDDDLESDDWQTSLAPLGSEVAAFRCHSNGTKTGKMVAAITFTQSRPKSSTLLADLTLTFLAGGTAYDGADVYIKDVIVPEFLFEGLSSNLGRIRFQDCIIGIVDLPADCDITLLPRFSNCHFGLVEGRAGLQDMPTEVFSDCTYDSFENPAQTTNAILALGLPLGTKVVLTALKKLYAQRGSGRRESAFFRGIDTRGKELVPDALALLKKFGFASKARLGDHSVWLPSKPTEFRRRALSILASPSASRDPLIEQSRDLGT